MHTINCTVSVISGLVQSVSIMNFWMDTSGNPIVRDYITVEESIDSNIATTISLHFEPLLTSHGGQYVCQASVAIPEIMALQNNSVTTDVAVQSK